MHRTLLVRLGCVALGASLAGSGSLRAVEMEKQRAPWQPTCLRGTEGIATDAEGRVYAGDTHGDGVIWRTPRGGGEFREWARLPVGPDQRRSVGLCWDEKRERLYVCASNHSSGSVFAFATDPARPTPQHIASGLGRANGVAVRGHTLFVSDIGKMPGLWPGRLWRIDLRTGQKRVVARLMAPNGIAFHENYLFVAQTYRTFFAGAVTRFPLNRRDELAGRGVPTSVRGCPDGLFIHAEPSSTGSPILYICRFKGCTIERRPLARWQQRGTFPTGPWRGRDGRLVPASMSPSPDGRHLLFTDSQEPDFLRLAGVLEARPHHHIYAVSPASFTATHP